VGEDEAREVTFGFDGAFLTLSDIHDGSSRGPAGELWRAHATLVLPGVRAETHVWLSELDIPLSAFFRDLSEHSRGWKGEKEWETYEHGLRLACTSDRLGHITVTVDLYERSGFDGWLVQGAVPIEAGQLDGLAAEFTRFVEPQVGLEPPGEPC
jgi:hypothetical protein